jgi:hypothetical protein
LAHVISEFQARGFDPPYTFLILLVIAHYIRKTVKKGAFFWGRKAVRLELCCYEETNKTLNRLLDSIKALSRKG